MRRVATLSLAISLAACSPDPGSQNATSTTTPSADARPNIVVILADDLGYSDLGFMGSEIRTPNIDALASSSTRFHQFYAAATCSPTRAMLLTGVDNHLAGLGNMAEHLAENQSGQPGYEGLLNGQVVTLPTLLRDAGYHTYMAGKWHLGGREGSRPHERGFENSFALMQGGASHFSDMRRIVSVYPQTIYLENGERVASLPNNFYSTEYFTDKTLAYIDANKVDDKPFFALLAPTAPHWPLQVKEKHLNLYAGVYDAGYDVIREARLSRMHELRVIHGDITNVPRLGKVPAWKELSVEQQRHSARSMEVYAAMVERLDFHVGRVVRYLRDNGLYENTIIVFVSDNGAEGNDRMRLEDNETWVPANYDLSYANIGRRNSYAMQQAGWGQVSSVPHRFFKGYSTDGGLRVPFTIRVPGSATSSQATDAVATIRDLVPTLLDYAQVPRHNGDYAGRDVHPLNGKSLRPLLNGTQRYVHGVKDALGWELFGHRAIRKGGWKLLWADGLNGSSGWQLFDMDDDPREINDVSTQHPEKFSELLADWKNYVQNNNVILPEGGADDLH